MRSDIVSTEIQAIVCYLVSCVLSLVVIKLYKRWEYSIEDPDVGYLGIGDALIPVWHWFVLTGITIHYTIYLIITIYRKSGLEKIVNKLNTWLE